MESSDPQTGQHFPLFLDLRDKPVLLVGGGSVAFRKARALDATGCHLTLVARQLSPEFRAWLREKRLPWEERSYKSGEAAGYFLVVSATDDPATNRTVFEDARSRDRLINVVDQPHLCNVYVPSVARRGSLQVAISTGGKCPALARQIRLQLEAHLSPRYAPLLEELAGIREEIRRKLPRPETRKRALEKIVRSTAVQRYLAGEEDGALGRMMRAWKRAKPAKR